MTDALAIPDPRTTPVPFGWAEAVAEPWLEQTQDWQQLDETAAHLAALVSWLQARSVDTTELLKAQRILEKRRADLLGDRWTRQTLDAPKVSYFLANVYRRIADNWDWLRPILLAATDPASVTQSRMLKLIDEHTPADTTACGLADIDDVVIGDVSLLAGSFQDRLASLPDGSIDMILTDPPYPADQQELWSDLAKLAVTKLAPRGYLMAMSGKIHLDEVMGRLGEHLHYGWMFCWPLTGAATRILGRNIRQTWKPVLCYTVGTFHRRDPVPDTIPSLSGAEKHLDGWQQRVAPARWLIEAFTPPTGLVVDPFLGSGSFGLATKQAGRRFVGVELRRDRFATAAERLA